MIDYNRFVNEKINFIKKVDKIVYPTFYDDNGKKAFKGFDLGTAWDPSDYKDIVTEDFLLIDPLKTERQSKGGYSYLISIFANFDIYDTRKHSVICTSNKHTANIWGRTYEVIPEKDEIYICYSSDFNERKNWNYLRKIWKKHVSFGSIYEYLYNEKVSFLEQKKIQNLFFNDFDKIKEINLKNFKSHIKELDTKEKRIINNTSKFLKYLKDFNSAREMFQDLFNPEKNGFEKIKYSEYQKSVDKYENNEVWFNCKTLCINPEKKK